MLTHRLAALSSLLALLFATLCQAVPNDNFADDRARDIVGGRKVLITVTQNSIEPRVVLPPELLVAHRFDIVAAQRAYSEKSQQLTMQVLQDSVPLIQALIDYDFNTPPQSALRPAVENSSWLRAQDIEFSEHGTVDFVLDKLDESDTRQMLLLYTNYYTDPMCATIVVDLRISLLVRRIPKGKLRADRFKPRYIPYQQSIRSVVTLANADPKDRKKNIARWAADNGQRARQALDIGIAALARLAPLSIELDETQAKDWRTRGKRELREIGGTLGWIREREGNAILMIDARDGAWTRKQIME